MPESLFQAVALQFEIAYPAYPASDGWVLSYTLTPTFMNPIQPPIQFAATTALDGESYAVNISGEETMFWEPGIYEWTNLVEKEGEEPVRLAVGTFGMLSSWPKAYQ
jgi:hypothetical protein